jgi:hypothetical protein
MPAGLTCKQTRHASTRGTVHSRVQRSSAGVRSTAPRWLGAPRRPERLTPGIRPCADAPQDAGATQAPQPRYHRASALFRAVGLPQPDEPYRTRCHGNAPCSVKAPGEVWPESAYFETGGCRGRSVKWSRFARSRHAAGFCRMTARRAGVLTGTSHLSWDSGNGCTQHRRCCRY